MLVDKSSEVVLAGSHYPRSLVYTQRRAAFVAKVLRNKKIQRRQSADPKRFERQADHRSPEAIRRLRLST
jgi:hypothetical protein